MKKVILIVLLSISFICVIFAQNTGDTPQESGGVLIIPNDNELVSLLTTAPNPNAVIKPLIQTKWSQGAPFSSLFPMVNGQQSICGCVNLAWAQLMKYHQYPARGRGQSGKIITVLREDTLNVAIPSVNLNVAYDWNNMLISYRSDGRDSNERQRNAAATLVHHIGAARGTYVNITEAMTNVFGYDKSIQLLERRYFTDAEWESIIRQQLDMGLPVFYWGNDTVTSHGFIIDGYDSTGRFHINWGWGGSYDGWYSLNNLNPRGRREFYNNQYIVINFKPDAGGIPAPYELALRSFSADKTAASQYESFNVDYYLRNIGSVAFNGELSAVLTDNTGNIAAVIGTRTSTSVDAGGSRISFVTCSIPENVRPGQYSLQIVTRPPNGEMKIITKSAIGEGVLNAINFTVTEGETSGYGLTFSAFSIDSTAVSKNERFNVNYTLRNPGSETFSGEISAVLTDNTGNIAAVIGSRASTSVNPGGARASFITCTVPNTVRSGRYQLRIAVKPPGKEQKIITMALGDVPNSLDITVR